MRKNQQNKKKDCILDVTVLNMYTTPFCKAVPSMKTLDSAELLALRLKPPYNLINTPAHLAHTCARDFLAAGHSLHQLAKYNSFREKRNFPKLR